MSAWLVSKAHLDYMVAAAIQYGVIPAAEGTATGELWLRENYASLGARYGDEDPGESYVMRPAPQALTPEQILSAAGCYEYQACEHDGWKASKAYALSAALRAAVIAKLPARLRKVTKDRYGSMREAIYQTPAYDACSWGINDPDPVEASA